MIAFELLLKYFSGLADPDEAMLVEDFAQASPDQYAYFKSLFESWVAAGKENYRLPDVQQEWNAFSRKHKIGSAGKPSVVKKLYKNVGIAAAVFVLIGASVYFLFHQQDGTLKTIVASGNKISAFSLDDGTAVMLRPGATLQHPEKFGNKTREVVLNGDASFDVRHDPSRPFRIHLPHALTIQVTGTAFTVYQKPDETDVVLKQGSVLFYNRTDTLKIAAGNTASYLIRQNKFVLHPRAPLTGSFAFRNVPLKEVVVQLNRYFQVHIQLQNPALNQCSLSAGFVNQSLKEILEAITVTFSLNYTIEKDNNIYINGEACN